MPKICALLAFLFSVVKYAPKGRNALKSQIFALCGHFCRCRMVSLPLAFLLPLSCLCQFFPSFFRPFFPFSFRSSFAKSGKMPPWFSNLWKTIFLQFASVETNLHEIKNSTETNPHKIKSTKKFDFCPNFVYNRIEKRMAYYPWPSLIYK